ncbi:unnamed protein product [marine sediment metagenome]|uniref:Uncharacterized protein n=1 Tax=marine sediment metagenome TaxID=412755 RepID=X0T8Z6_9ZZZZ
MNKTAINIVISTLVILTIIAGLIMAVLAVFGNTFFWLQMEIIPAILITLLILVFWVVNKNK